MFILGWQQTWNHLGLITRHVKSHVIMWCPYTSELNNKITNIQGVSKFVPIVNCILHKAINAYLGKRKLIQVRNLSQ